MVRSQKVNWISFDENVYKTECVKENAAEVALVASKMAEGYFAFAAALAIAQDERSALLAPLIESGQIVSVGRVRHKCGGDHLFHFVHYLGLVKSDEFIGNELEVVWFSRSLLRLGDLLQLNGYFDRAPELELIRHLRNGVAHNNRFRIDDPEKLKRFPAHNRLARFKNPSCVFEISKDLNGKSVLFDFIEPGDLICLFQSVADYLERVAKGEPLRD